jgi:hypothetical protein
MVLKYNLAFSLQKVQFLIILFRHLMICSFSEIINLTLIINICLDTLWRSPMSYLMCFKSAKKKKKILNLSIILPSTNLQHCG